MSSGPQSLARKPMASAPKPAGDEAAADENLSNWTDWTEERAT